MHRILIALAATLAMGGCASTDTANTKLVCENVERSTGSNMRTRECRRVAIPDSEKSRD